MTLIVDNDYLEAVSKREKEVTHKYYDFTVQHQIDMGVHVEGEKPAHLLDIHRPNETPEIKQYRLDIWQAVTMGLSEKIINTVNRIFNNRFYKITYGKVPGTIKKEESLASYTEEFFPAYRSIIHFIKETFTRKCFADPNSVMVIMPTEFIIDDTERLEPVPVIYRAEQVVDFSEDEYYVIHADKNIIKIIDRDSITVYERDPEPDPNKDLWTIKFSVAHNIGKPPAFRLGGTIKGLKEPYWFFSFIGGVLPHWNRVVTLSSDLDANYINHLYMERWEYAVECEKCHGSGFFDQQMSELGETFKAECKACKGSGSVTRGPYGIYQVRHDAINPDREIPTPPAAYITKPTDIVGIIENRIEVEKANGMSSVNMEVLNDTPAAESGIAKAIDRQDLDTFLMRYSMHIFNYVLPQMYEFISWWRYGETLSNNPAEIAKLQPVIHAMKEMDFTVLSLKYLTDEYKDASTSKVSSNYLRQLEEDIMNTRFADKEQERVRNLLIVRLQPFPGVGTDGLSKIAALPGHQAWEIYKSSHTEELVQKAIEAHPDFLKKDFGEQRDIIDAMAQEIVPIVDMEEIMGEKEEEEDANVDNPTQTKANEDKNKVPTLE
jgi:hypothetical protein